MKLFGWYMWKYKIKESFDEILESPIKKWNAQGDNKIKSNVAT